MFSFNFQSKILVLKLLPGSPVRFSVLSFSVLISHAFVILLDSDLPSALWALSGLASVFQLSRLLFLAMSGCPRPSSVFLHLESAFPSSCFLNFCLKGPLVHESVLKLSWPFSLSGSKISKPSDCWVHPFLVGGLWLLSLYHGQSQKVHILI